MCAKRDEENCSDGVLDNWKMIDNQGGENYKTVGIQLEIRLYTY